jgi:hypothetical protein
MRRERALTIKLQEFVEIIGQILHAATIGNLNLPSGHIEHASSRNRNRRVGSVGPDLLCAFGSIDRELRHFQKPPFKMGQAWHKTASLAAGSAQAARAASRAILPQLWLTQSYRAVRRSI